MQVSDKILNDGLHLSMEFGEEWLKPIAGRLSKKYPDLNLEELDLCEKLCKKVNTDAHDYVFNNPIKINGELKFIEFNEFKNYMEPLYVWINDKNMRRLYSQSCYYAWK